jgi:hypothetical protein
MKRTIVFVSLACLAAIPTILKAQSEVGTWKLNTAKSTFSGVAVPKSTTVTVETQEAGIRNHTEGVAGDGSAINFSYSAKYDRKDNPITGSGAYGGADSMSLRRIDANTTELTSKKSGKVVRTTRVSISKDGKVMTANAKGTSPDGKPVNVRAVFDKQ